MRYAKFIVAALTAGLTALTAAITDDKVTNAEWIMVALAAVGAIGVYLIPNTPPPVERPTIDMTELR
jgi:hypothetical protein